MLRTSAGAVSAAVAVMMTTLWPAAIAIAAVAPATTTVTIRVDGDAQVSGEMLAKLQERGAARAAAIVAAPTGYDLRVLVLARAPQWRQVFGASASGAVAVLSPRGDLLFMHIRQRESSVGRAMDRMADEILDRLPALLRGEKVQ